MKYGSRNHAAPTLAGAIVEQVRGKTYAHPEPGVRSASCKSGNHCGCYMLKCSCGCHEKKRLA